MVVFGFRWNTWRNLQFGNNKEKRKLHHLWKEQFPSVYLRPGRMNHVEEQVPNWKQPLWGMLNKKYLPVEYYQRKIKYWPSSWVERSHNICLGGFQNCYGSVIEASYPFLFWMTLSQLFCPSNMIHRVHTCCKRDKRFPSVWGTIFVTSGRSTGRCDLEVLAQGGYC